MAVAAFAMVIGNYSPYLCELQEGPERSASSRSPWTLSNPHPEYSLSKYWLNSTAVDCVVEVKGAVFQNNPEGRKTTYMNSACVEI